MPPLQDFKELCVVILRILTTFVLVQYLVVQ